MARFQPGQSGNPRGGHRGVLNTLTKVRRILEPYAAELAERTLADALAGDQAATRTVLEVFVAASAATRKSSRQQDAQAE